MLQNWDKKWEKFSLDYAKTTGEHSKHDWGNQFSQICILTANITLSCVVTHIVEFNMKSKNFNNKNFKKQLNSFQSKDVQSFIKYIIMDFLILLIEQNETRDFLLSVGIDDESFEKEMFDTLQFTKEERFLYYKFKPVSGTLEHSVHLIEILGAQSESKNEGLLLGIEYFKKNFFDNIKKHLFNVFKKK